MKNVAEVNAIVIGASSGIGRETARLLARSGQYDRVGITARRREMLEETASVAPGKFETAVFDACSPDATDKLDTLAQKMGGAGLIIFCSGTGHVNDALDEGPELDTLRLNAEAFTRIAVWSYNYLASRGGGRFAAVTSVMGLRGSRSAPAYAASKAYQINYLEGLRQKAVREKSGVVVTDIRPGSVETDMMKGEGHFWITAPGRAAELIVRAVSRGRRLCYVSPRWRLIAALLRTIPGSIYEKM